MNLLLIYPMFAMVLLTIVVAVIGFLARLNAIRSGEVDFRYFKTFDYGKPNEMIVKTTRHFANLFEVPVLFYTGCIIAMILPLEGFWIMLWAWLFVFARVSHAVIHIGPNKIRPRVVAFFLGNFAALAIWIQIVCKVALS